MTDNGLSERIRLGMAHARRLGVHLGRPKAAVDPAQVAALRRAGLSWSQIGQKLGVGATTARRAARGHDYIIDPGIDPAPFDSPQPCQKGLEAIL